MDSTNKNFLTRVTETCRRYTMFPEKGKILVAVSGGPDSMALLHILLESGHTVEVFHLDHGTRQGQSQIDADFVAEYTHQLGIPCHVVYRPVETEATHVKASFEEYARSVRYEEMCAAAHRCGCIYLATGHHAEDQAETVLLRILRGTSLHGLTGIPPVREEKKLRLVRPLLEVKRSQILEYLTEKGIPYREDSSNQDQQFLRNRVRHELIPLLEKRYNPRIKEALHRLSDNLFCDDELIRHHADVAYTACVAENDVILREPFSHEHPAVQRRVLQSWAWRMNTHPDHDHIVAATDFICTGKPGHAYDLGQGTVLRNTQDISYVDVGTVSVCEPVLLTVPGEARFGRFTFVARYLDSIPTEPLSLYCTSSRQVFDADALHAPFTIRTRMPGDRIQPLGMSGTRKLKRYMSELNLTAHTRASLPLLLSRGRIAWVTGYAPAEWAAVHKETKHCIEVEVHNESKR